MGKVIFDTLALARRLRDRDGFRPEQAERAAQAIADAMSDQVATKADLADLKADLTRFILTVATGQVAVLLGAMFAPARAGG